MANNTSPSTNTPIVPRQYRLPFFMLVSCFALWGLLNNMTDNLVPAFSKIFMINASESAGVQISFYGAYAVLAIFASILLEEFSYKAGVLIGLGLYMLGALCYIPAAIGQSFDIYLVAIFVLAGGLSILETTCNPFVLSMGAENTAVRRLNFAQAFNPIGSLAGIFLAKYFILANLNDADIATRKTMPAEQLNEIVSQELFWVCVPYVGLVAAAAVIWFFFCRYKTPETGGVDAVREETRLPLGSKLGRLALCLGFIAVLFLIQFYGDLGLSMVQQILLMMLGPIAFLFIVRDYRVQLFKLLRLPRYVCGVAAQFFYVGVQIAVWTWTIKYVMSVFPGVQESSAANYYICSIVLFIVCRAVTVALMKRFNPANMMALFAVAGMVCCVGVMYLPPSVAVWTLVAISGCMSLMFPTIYGIALRGLGSEVKLGAAGLIMAILGGAVITPYMGGIIDTTMREEQIAYFEQAQREQIVAMEQTNQRKSTVTGDMLALYTMTKTPEQQGQVQQALKDLAALQGASESEFTIIAKKLPGCSHLSDMELTNLRTNLPALGLEGGAVTAQQLPLLPALYTVTPGQADILTDLISRPIDMEQLKTEQERIAAYAARRAFVVPIVCFTVVFLYGFFFRNAHRKESAEA